jgi:hypothetical protein
MNRKHADRRKQRERAGRIRNRRYATMHPPTIFERIHNDLDKHEFPHAVTEPDRVVHAKCVFFPPEETTYRNSKGDAEVDLLLSGDEATGTLTTVCPYAWHVGQSPGTSAQLSLALAISQDDLKLHFDHQLGAIIPRVCRMFHTASKNSNESLSHITHVLLCITTVDAAFHHVARTGDVLSAIRAGDQVFCGAHPAKTRVAEIVARLVEKNSGSVQRVTDYFNLRVSPVIDSYGPCQHGTASQLLGKIQSRLSHPYNRVAALVSDNRPFGLTPTLSTDFESETIAWIDALLDGVLDEKAS